jgi:N-formylglutamate deformylase
MSRTMRPLPYEIRRPTGPARLLYDSPHSGRFYPDDFTLGSPLAVVRRAEDAYVDELIAPATELGALVLSATYPRSYIDLNRTPDDIDADLLAEPWPGPLAPTDYSARGLGLIRRYVEPGVEVNAHRLSVADVTRRLTRIYKPYHRMLDALVFELHESLPRALHVDWHSMKSVGSAMTPDGAGASRPDFVVSDGEGTTAAPQVTALVAATLRALGYDVSVNRPYKGGAIVRRIGDPAAGVHSVQVEINRALYLDETRVEKSSGFDDLQRGVMDLTRALAAVDPAFPDPARIDLEKETGQA